MAKYITLEEFYALIDAAAKESGTFTVAIDGGSGSGKTTLAREIEKRHPQYVTVFHMDDFYLRKEQRSEERYKEPGGNVDRERFLEEVLKPISKGEASEVIYRPIDCRDFSISDGIMVKVNRIRIVEGAYSHHPYLRDYYDLRVFLDIDKELQGERIKKRNTPQEQERFFSRWIPFEDTYFNHFDIKEKSDVVILVEEI